MKQKILPYLLLAPMMLIMGVLVFYPIAATFSYSLKKWKLTAPGDIRFIGFDNYKNILKSESFWYSLQNTLFLLVLVATSILGVLVSLFLNIRVKGAGILLAVAVLPWALPPYVNGILWRFVFHSGYGFMNKVLIGLGMVDKPVEWLTSRWMLLVVVAIVVVWRSVPFMALVCLAGRQSIPHGLYEAAKIDGATKTQALRRITIPMVMPSFTICLFLTLTNSFKLFDQNLALTAGRPFQQLGNGETIKTTEMLALNIVNAFGTSGGGNRGVGQAKAVIFFIVVAAISIIQLQASRRKEVQQ